MHLNIKTVIGQGTILGPLIFMFYINDIIKSVGKLMINMCANDCILFASENNWNGIKQNVQTNLNNMQF